MGGGNGSCLLFPGYGGSVGHEEEGLDICGHFFSRSCFASMCPKSLCWPLSHTLETLLRCPVAFAYPCVSWNEGPEVPLEGLCADWPAGASLWATGR